MGEGGAGRERGREGVGREREGQVVGGIKREGGGRERREINKLWTLMMTCWCAF